LLFMATLLGLPLLGTYRRRRKTKVFLNANRELRDPDPLAERRVRQHTEPCPVIGSAIETLVHSTLNTRTNFTELGWDPAHVQIVDTGREFDSRPILTRIPGGLLPLASNETNDLKFVLVGHSHPFKDDENNLTLSFARTDWQTHKTVRNSINGVETDDELALEFGNLDVELSRVPSSVALHYIVRLHDDSVLLLKRAPHIAHDPNKWSISGEEQFKLEDFEEGTLVRVFRRALCEEVVGLFDHSPGTLDARWRDHIANKIIAMKLWGLVFEEHACVTSLLAFYQFSMAKDEFIEWREDLAKRLLGTIDNEGRWHATSTEELSSLLRTGSCQAWPLWPAGHPPVRVRSGHLGKTSRYRAFRLLRAIRPDLIPQSYSVLQLS